MSTHTTLTFAAVTAVLAACSSSPTDPSADAARPFTAPSFAANHTVPGIPGDPNCEGQSTAYLAQASKNGLIPEGFRGLGGISRITGLTMEEIKAAVDAFCNPPVEPPV
jgi:hypothetical protein